MPHLWANARPGTCILSCKMEGKLNSHRERRKGARGGGKEINVRAFHFM